MPVVRVVEATRFRVRFDESGHLGAAPSLNRKNTNLAVSLENAEHNDFACGTPTAFALPAPAKRGLVALHGTLEGLSALFLEGLALAKRKNPSMAAREVSTLKRIL
ncbi:MAG TPA: hypothetical protein PLR20_06475 [Syntrophales bacterium]|nr:hypothetical protein [Syntrophales bacterium]HPI56161.1 hypothetical protein [Syntrophales bacterium]HPN24349.1 hypothetical protein [Syntrophales bacterium]HQM28979.1 hypothetical protein [Syntrophales bacterium]